MCLQKHVWFAESAPPGQRGMVSSRMMQDISHLLVDPKHGAAWDARPKPRAFSKSRMPAWSVRPIFSQRNQQEGENNGWLAFSYGCTSQWRERRGSSVYQRKLPGLNYCVCAVHRRTVTLENQDWWSLTPYFPQKRSRSYRSHTSMLEPRGSCFRHWAPRLRSARPNRPPS